MVTLGGDARDAGISSAILAMSWESVARRTIDLTVAAIGLLVLAIPMFVIALVIRCASDGPALFRQQRVGLGGRTFTMYKFRTMRTGVGDEMLRELIAAELRGEDTSVNGSFKIDSDPRITRVGNFLRKTSLDELPQLINVLFGDMALVGPRPCLEWEARMFPAEFRPRFSVRPGLTGLWQVSGRSAMGTLEMLHLDLTYVHSRKLTGDLSILVRTIPAMLKDSTAK
jgi:lipopolysaccharide/colanic/teichoic acid biosynthesis glycosyltransferase